MDLNGATVVVTGGTDGIGAATARELRRRGARVVIVGRSAEKGNTMMASARHDDGNGTLDFIQADFSLMTNVRTAVDRLQELLPRIDILIHCVGILIAHKEYTSEGIEKDFAVGYLSRFVMTKDLVGRELLASGSTLVNVAASGPKLPKIAKLEFDDLAAVEARYGMQSHGQAQLANDLFSLEAAERWGLSVLGYGPGSVDTGIRRELPKLLVTLIKPFFAFSTRTPEAVGLQIVDLLTLQSPPAGEGRFFHKQGRFMPDEFVLDRRRRSALWSVSEALEQKAFGHTLVSTQLP